jgi:hypothetical protein
MLKLKHNDHITVTGARWPNQSVFTMEGHMRNGQPAGYGVWVGLIPGSCVIMADHYREEEARLVKDPIVIAMAQSLTDNDDLHVSGFAVGALREYQRRGGTQAASIGSVASALRTILGVKVVTVKMGDTVQVEDQGTWKITCKHPGDDWLVMEPVNAKAKMISAKERKPDKEPSESYLSS